MSAPRAPMRVVLDTNVLVAILAFDDCRLEPLRARWRAGTTVPLTNEACLAEIERVLTYAEFVSRGAVARPALDDYLSRCEVIPSIGAVGTALPICRDLDDQKFLTLAGRGRADVLVTRDKLLLELSRRTPFAILSPEDLVAAFAVHFDPNQGENGAKSVV